MQRGLSTLRLHSRVWRDRAVARSCFAALLVLVVTFASTSTSTKNGFIGGVGQGRSASADRAYEAWAKEYPVVAKSGRFLGTPCDKDTVYERFQELAQLTDSEENALELVETEPILLLSATARLRATWDELKSLEKPDSEVRLMGVVQKNPRILTIPDFELRRTGPSLESLDSSASIVALTRPLGPFGFFIATIGGFIAFLCVLRVIGNFVGPTWHSVMMLRPSWPDLGIPDGSIAVITLLPIGLTFAKNLVEFYTKKKAKEEEQARAAV